MIGQALLRRSAYRVLSRSYNIGAKSSILGITSQQKQHTLSRPFSTGIDSSDDDSVRGNLSALITREIDEENETESNIMPDELKDLKDQISKNWNFSIEEKGIVQMFKMDSISGAKVRISFHCQDTISANDLLDHDPHNDEHQIIMDEDQEEEEDVVAVKFKVDVTRAGKTMVLNCLSMDSEASVESIFLKDDETTASSNEDDKLYQGPEYSELASDLQETFNEFLQKDCGVDEDVAAFISMYADYKEQIEYIGWLKGVKSIISP